MANDLEMRAALERLTRWAQTMTQGLVYSGDHPVALARAALSRTEATGGEQAVSDARDVELMRDSLEIINQLMACHEEPTCPAIDVGSCIAERLIERLSRASRKGA